MSSEGSRSRSDSRNNQRSPSPKRQSKPNKLFVTNLDANGDTRKLEDELKTMFSKFGEIVTLVVKRSHNNEYCFAFVDYKEGDDATDAMKELNGVQVGGKDMKVELQDNSRRRKATQFSFDRPRSGGQCYKCGKPGHFARQCRSDRQEQRRGRSRSRSKDRKKKKSHRHRSESSESAHAKKKDKKKHKSHKKHKKSKKKHYSSDSSDSD